MENLPFYQTRKFWILPFILEVVISSYLVLGSSSGIDIEKIGFAIGGSVAYIFGYTLLGMVGSISGLLIYFVIQVWLFKKTFFKSSKVRPLYPIASSVLYLLGLAHAFIFMSGM